MMIQPRNRALIAALLSASSVVAVAGCTAAKKLSSPQPAGSEDTPKKEYQYRDFSTGKSFFKPIDPSSRD